MAHIFACRAWPVAISVVGLLTAAAVVLPPVAAEPRSSSPSTAPSPRHGVQAATIESLQNFLAGVDRGMGSGLSLELRTRL